MRPPNSACEELDGRPSSHVSRFHRIAPHSPAKITVGVIFASSTSPLEIVSDPCVFPRLVDDGTVRSPIEYEMNTMWPVVGQAREEMSDLLHMSNSANCP